VCVLIWFYIDVYLFVRNDPFFCAITSKRLFFTQCLHTTQVVCYSRRTYCHVFL